MIDGIELIALEETHQVRELEGDGAGRLENRGDARHEGIDVGDLGEHIVADHQVGHAPRGSQSLGRCVVEEHDLGLDAALARSLGDICRRLDSQAGDPLLDEILEKVTVVAGELDHEALVIEPQPVRYLHNVVLAVFEPCR